MRRMPMILTSVLALQVAGAIALAVTGPDYGTFEETEPLVAFDAEAVKELAIDESGGEPVVLRRDEDGWTLPDLHDFPADRDKVSALLERLADLKRGLPVAVSDSAPTRFRLTAEDHERRIVLKGNDGVLGEVLFGTSPSYRYVHARTPDDVAVYSVAFTTYDAGTRIQDWMDREFLHLPEEDIVRVELPSLTLLRKDDGLVIDGLAEDEETVESDVRSLVRKLARPSVDTVEGKGEAALARIDEPDLTIILERSDGTSFTYRVKRIEDEDEYLLASSAHDYLFRVPKYAVQALFDASREKLVRPAAAAIEDNDAKTGEAAADKGEGPG